METEAKDTARYGFRLLCACLLAVFLVSCSTLHNSWRRIRQFGSQVSEKSEEKRIPLPPLAEDFKR